MLRATVLEASYTSMRKFLPINFLDNQNNSYFETVVGKVCGLAESQGDHDLNKGNRLSNLQRPLKRNHMATCNELTENEIAAGAKKAHAASSAAPAKAMKNADSIFETFTSDIFNINTTKEVFIDWLVGMVVKEGTQICLSS